MGQLSWVCGFSLISLCLAAPITVFAESGKPLTLTEALSTAELAHPDLLMAQADRDIALADVDIAASRQDVNVNLEGILRSGRTTVGNDGFARDNSIRLAARKTLYDFGRTEAAQLAAKSEVDAREAELISARDRRRIDIMARYFDVLSADQQYTADNEYMTVAYISFDQGKDRLETGQISQVDLAGLEAHYQSLFVIRNASEQRQRIARALLANAMNQPDKLSVDLEDPKLPDNHRVLPEFELLVPMMQDNNPRLRAQQEMLAAAQKRLEAVRAENRPTLDAEVQAADYSRSAATRDGISAGLILNWPLYQGNRVDARMAREQAQFHKLQAGAQKLKMELTQLLLETHFEILQLQRAGRNAAKKQSEYRDLQLEKSRGLYEMELKSTLGSAMADTVDANLRIRKNEYQLALAFARLEALLGQPLAGNALAGK